MIVLDATVVNVALPTIQRELHFSQASLAWVLDAYLITFGGLLLLAGRLGDLIGPRKVFLTGLAIFTVSSAFCGFSQSAGELIGARFAQGVGAATVSGTLLGILVTIFPEPGERTRALGVYAAVSTSGSAFGLLVGGLLTQAASWHWIFFVNIPIGIAALVLGTVLIEESPGLGLRDGADFLGAILVTGATMALVYTIVKTADYGWLSGRTAGVGAGALVLMGAFFLVERRVRQPILPLRVFRSRNATGAALVRFLYPVGMFGIFFTGTLYMQHVLGYSPLSTGLAFLPMALISAGFSLFLTARIVQRIGAKATLIPGLIVLLAALALIGIVPVHGHYVSDLLPGITLFGIGIGLAFAPSISLAMADAAPTETGLASGLANISVQIGTALGVAIIATISTARTKSLLSHGSSKAAALVGGYHLGIFVGFGVVVACLVLAVFVFADPNVGKAPRLEEVEAAELAEAELGF